MQPNKPLARILIIDDEQDLCQLLAEYLRSKGYETATAFSGEEGLEKVRQSRYQLVFSDICMPNLSGMAVLEQVKRLDPSIEVVLITAYANVASAVEALKSGAFDYIEKPFRLEKVLAVIEDALDRRELKTVKGLEETARAVFSTLRLQDLLPLLSDLALSIAPSEDAFVALRAGGKLELSAWSSSNGQPDGAARLAAAEIVARVGEPSRCLAASPANDPRFRGAFGTHEVRFLLGYPMVVQDGLLGVLGLCRTRGEDPFSAAEVRNFSLFAALVTEAVRAASLYAELEQKMRDLQRAEARAIQSEKMAALGRIASGIAHELRNPLTAVLFASQRLRGQLADPEQSRMAGDIEHAAKRCDGVIKSLLSFSREPQKDQVPCAVPELLEAALENVEKDTGPLGVQVSRDFQPSAKVLVNSIQLRQVFYNILRNAAQAMPQGGSVCLRVRELCVTRELLKRWSSPGAAALLREVEDLGGKEGELWTLAEIKDSGVGISAQELPLIFEPFFTTKPAGEGSGLGLYLSYEIVNANGGYLWAASEGQGKGTTFFVALPAVKTGAPEAGAATKATRLSV